MWGIVRQKVARGIPAPFLEHSMQRIMPAISWPRDYSAAPNEVTRGLLDRYGPTRVVDTPITQTGFAAPGVGSTYHGLRAFMTFKSSMQVALGNKRYFGTVAESVSQAEGKLNSPNHLRPLSPHLPIYKPQLNSTVSIFNRMSAAFLTAIFLSSYLICVKIGSIGFTFEPVYQFFFYSSKLILTSAQITALALFYHFYQGLRHIFSRIK